ncbi:trimeric intracellular cation channel family protein [Haloferacaceae archaeon DSL9]
MSDAFALMNAVGLLAFAVAGSLKGVDADLDLFGITVLGVLTALGGGMVRDTLVGRVPAALTSMSDVAFAVAGVGIAVVASRRVRGAVRDHPILLVADAVGLAAFAATGALVGLDAGISPFGVVVLATLTGVGGGSICDLLLTRVPSVLKEDFYATPAAAGGVGCWLAVELGVSTDAAALGAAAAVLGLRLAALRYEWRLPTA